MHNYAAYDKLGLPLYIVSLESYEIIYINEEGIKLFGEIVGHKCYEALNGTKNICSECIPGCQLEEKGSCQMKTRYLAKVEKYIDTYESLVILPNGLKGRLCLVVDVTKSEKNRLANEKNEKAQKDMQYLLNIQSSFIKSAKSMMSAATLDGKMIFINDNMLETLGYLKDEIFDMKISDFHPVEISCQFKEKFIPQAIAEGIWKGDSWIYKKDGTLLPVRQIVFPIVDDKGEIIATAAIMDDISKVLEMERMNRYQLAIMESSTSYIGIADLDGETLYHSPGAYRMLGYDSKNVAQWNRKSPHPAWYSKFLAEEAIPQAMKEGQWTGRGELINRYGEHIPIEQTIFPVYDENQQLLGTGTIIQNITAQIKQEKEIDAARRMLRTIIDTAPSAIFWKDKNSCFLGANKQFAFDAGVNDPNQLIGKNDYDLYPPEIADIYVAADMKLFESEEELFHVEEPFQDGDGNTFWVSTSKVLIRDENNEPYALLGIYDDITKLKQNEMKLEEAIKQAEEASRAKGDFLSRMSHEIRTPMNAIIGMTRIGESTNDIDRMRYCFDKIDKASRHLLGLINDILDMSKIEANKLELIEEEFNFEKMLENICNVINIKADEKKQTIVVDIDEKMPQRIIADEMRISQVITNLLANAVKFTPEKGKIILSAQYCGLNDDGKIKIIFNVIDNGIGLTEPQMKKLFHSFEQAETGTSRKYGGTGLGLAISKKIVELMGGTISVTSKINQGSKFTFSVFVGNGLIENQQLHDFVDNHAIKVLVIDDDEDILDYFRRILDSKKIVNDTVNNGSEAIELVAEAIKNNQPYNVIFVDYMMEYMDGIETTRQIKRLSDNNINIIMVSQTEWVEIETEAKKAGVDKFIPKPLFQSPIFDCISQSLNHHQKTVSSYSNKGIFIGKKILLAEDIEINREIVISLLEETGVEIDCAINGLEAVEMFNKGPRYDVILMDIQMPLMGGLEATMKIKSLKTKKSQEIPIIAMTANAFKEDVEACKKAGMVDHIGKPVDFDVLIAKLKIYFNL